MKKNIGKIISIGAIREYCKNHAEEAETGFTVLNFSNASYSIPVDDIKNKMFLHLAIQRGDLYLIVHLVTEAGADVNAKDQYGCTPLHYAIYSGCINTIRFLIDNGADCKDNDLLKLAIVNGHLDTVKYFIEEKGVDLNFTDEHGMTPLFCAVVYEKKEIVEYLLKKGANVNAVVLYDAKVLHIASRHCLLEIVKCLITMGAEIDVRDSDGNTPLHLAVQDNECQNKGQKLDVVKCLVNSGADINVKNKNGKSVINIATDLNVIEYLSSV